MSDLDRAAAAIRAGQLVVYPTETVYGLAANAIDADAVERVFTAKDRDRSKPISLAVPDVETALDYVTPTERELAFIKRFLPGPVTVVCERKSPVPDVLTAGRDQVGLRIPDHELALELLEIVAPITATSANVSGQANARRAQDVDLEIHETAAVVLDGGKTGGAESTVVDVKADEIHRRGAIADEIEAWFANN